MKEITWKKKTYGSYDGKLTIMCDNINGWEADKKEKEEIGEPRGLCLVYEHIDGEGGATNMSFEEAKDLRDALNEYVEFMEN